MDPSSPASGTGTALVALAVASAAALARRTHAHRLRAFGHPCPSRPTVPGATSLLARPKHNIPPAKWHKKPPAHGTSPPAAPETKQNSSNSLGTEDTAPRRLNVLSAEQVRRYYEDGFLVLENFIPDAELSAAQADATRLVDMVAQRLVAAGKLSQLYEGLGWTARLLRIAEEFPDAPLMLIKAGVILPAFQRLYELPKLLDALEDLGLGRDVAAHTAWNLRCKMPSHEDTVVPWHQDNSYWEPRLWDEHIVTGWIALVDATEENGCMQFIRGGHKTGKTAVHTIGSSTNTWYTEMSEEHMAKQLLGLECGSEEFEALRVTVPAKRGTVILFGGTEPHRSLPNVSNEIRWSCDFRWHAPRAARPGKTDRPLDFFFGLKDSLLVRKSDDPNYKADWTEWAAMDRTQVQHQAKHVAGDGQEETKVPFEFDKTIVGPWMDLWDIESMNNAKSPNVHTAAYIAAPDEARDISSYLRSKTLMW